MKDEIETIEVGTALPERSFSPTAVSLFLYNASIWNPHRIHYDERYTTEVEGHPGIVIDGPLQGDWLTQSVLEWIDMHIDRHGGKADLIGFEYSNRRASYLGETLTVGGEVKQVDQERAVVTFELFVRNEAGEVVTPGRAEVELR
jgi:3-methylfumaryl-CoA hydratase